MPRDQVTGITFPFLQKDLTDMFGDPRDGEFETTYISVIDLSEFADRLGHVKDYEGNPWRHRIYGNYIMEGALKKAFNLICGRGLAKQLKTYDGCFNVRVMKGSRSLSVHSWGLALDFNAATSPFSASGQLITDFSTEFVRCFYEAGFEWGGDWRSIKDAMHFQLPWTTSRWVFPNGPKPFVRD